MSAPLEAVLDLLPAGAGPQAVTRVEHDPSGSLVLTLEDPQGRTWLRHQGSRLVPFGPRDDGRLPLASSLRVSDRPPPRVLAYRPGRRLVLRHEGNGSHRVEKGYRSRRWREAEARYRIALGSKSDDSVDFRMPSLLGTTGSRASLELEHLDGSPIGLAETEADRFFVVGASLRSFQDGSVRGLRRFGPVDELRVVDEWATRAEPLTGWRPSGWSGVRSGLADAAIKLKGTELALAHRDLHDGQFLVTDRRVALMDFDLLCSADRALDPANLLTHLTLRALQGKGGATEAGAHACGSAFLEGLDRNRELGFWRRLRFYEATSFLRLAFVYSLRPRWRELAPTLADYGRRCLAEVDR